MKHTYLVTEPIKEFLERDEEMPVMRDPYPSAYYRQEQKSGLIGIYETEGFRGVLDATAAAGRNGIPRTSSSRPTSTAWRPTSSGSWSACRCWAKSGIKRVVCGAIPHTPDSNPFLLGPAAGLRNFWHCNGASIGIAAGAGCGKYLAQWMVHGDAEINMAGLDPRRFGRHAPGDYTKAKSHEDYEHMYALHLPGEERPASRKARTTPLYDKSGGPGLRLYRGQWLGAAQVVLPGRPRGGDRASATTILFEVVAEECRAVRERVGLLGSLQLRQVRRHRRRCRGLLEPGERPTACPRREGGITLTHYLSAEGRIAGESTITRLAEGRYLRVVGGRGGGPGHGSPEPADPATDEDVTVTNITDDWGVLVLAGPRSRDLLAKPDRGGPWPTTVLPLAHAARRSRWPGWPCAPSGSTTWASWAGSCTAPWTGWKTLYDALWAAGQDFGIANFGVYAVNSLRMEKAYKGWGAELTNEITLVEADMERFVRLRQGGFRGQDGHLEGQAGRHRHSSWSISRSNRGTAMFTVASR